MTKVFTDEGCVSIMRQDQIAQRLAHLQIKEGLPVLKDQLGLLKSSQSEKHLMTNWNMVEIEEAIRQLETGEDLLTFVTQKSD